MKTVYSIFLTLAVISLSSFSNLSPTLFIKEIKSDFTKVKDSIYFSKYETTNKQYRSYLMYLKETNQMEQYKQNLLDTTKWTTKNKNFAPFVYYYHSHSSYDNYPVVNVSYENAVNYCNWLTEQYNANPSKKFKKVIFRLPTESEWLYAATGGNSQRIYAWEGNQIRNKKGVYLANIKKVNEANISYDNINENYKVVVDEFISRYDNLSPKNAFYANDFGLYNMIGNAAEMIATKGIAKGGSYNDGGFDARVQNQKKYTNASPEIGFRVLMEIVEF